MIDYSNEFSFHYYKLQVSASRKEKNWLLSSIFLDELSTVSDCSKYGTMKQSGADMSSIICSSYGADKKLLIKQMYSTL